MCSVWCGGVGSVVGSVVLLNHGFFHVGERVWCGQCAVLWAVWLRGVVRCGALGGALGGGQLALGLPGEGGGPGSCSNSSDGLRPVLTPPAAPSCRPPPPTAHTDALPQTPTPATLLWMWMPRRARAA